MYQTLYRKYRPNSFDEVVGQDIIIKTLKNEIKYNQLNHAYLFTGPRGTGKTSIAKILAKTINCNDIHDGVACNECVNCTQIKNHQSTDIIEIDAASNNGVDEIRELKSKVNLVPSSGKYKVYIIDEVHMLTIGAFNALLKTLEEPPAHIIFILATTDPHKIPTTILSRCQRFDFKRISINSLMHRLNIIINNEKIKIDDEAVAEIARLSDGGMRDALSMLDQVISYSIDKITVEDVHEINGTLSQVQLKSIIEYLIAKNLSSELELIDQLNDNGKNLVKLTEEIIQFLRNLLLCQTAPKYFEQQNYNKEMYQKISREIKYDALLEMIKEFNLTLSEMKYTNNPKLLLEILLIRLMNLDELEYHTQEKVTDDCGNLRNETISNEISNQTSNKTYDRIDEAGKKNIKKQNFDSTTFDTVIETRVNNALAGFSKKYFLETKEKLESIQSLLMDSKYSQYIAMLLDATLKAAGNDYLIYVNKDKHLADIFNHHIIEMEVILYQQYNNEYKIISVDEEKWNQIKQEFNQKTKKYIYHPEEYNIKQMLEYETKNNDVIENKTDEITELFGDIVEYEEE
ncbi:MAG: DNA polymerase III subunit gamma/tau [Bacilli bacterium]|nr:DNA polymerase III subunit gamma/tau [Bacilli bacterium]